MIIKQDTRIGYSSDDIINMCYQPITRWKYLFLILWNANDNSGFSSFSITSFQVGQDCLQKYDNIPESPILMRGVFLFFLGFSQKQDQ